ncbi:MAG: peroxiredoxin Q/BCP [Candidatus Latescibacterota bacterium]|jgi:peroxiredoxin Q/BCP
MGATVIGVSGDTVEGQRIFKKVNDLNFALLADTEGNVAKTFGVPLRKGGTVNKTINGEEFSLTRNVTAKRWTFIIGKDGKIIHKDTGVKAALDSDNTIAALKALTAE